MTHESRAQRPVPLADTQGTLALHLFSHDEPDGVPGPRPAEPTAIVPVDKHLYSWIGRFARHVAEIVGGSRNASQLARWTTEEVYADLVHRSLTVSQTAGHEPGQGKQRPVPKVTGVRACRIDDDLVEAALLLEYGEGVRALAACFRRSGTGWKCTALEFGQK